MSTLVPSDSVTDNFPGSPCTITLSFTSNMYPFVDTSVAIVSISDTSSSLSPGVGTIHGMDVISR